MIADFRRERMKTTRADLFGQPSFEKIVGEKFYFCFILNSCLPIIMVPLRGGPVFAATEKFTVPLPVPTPPEVIVIQLALGVAFQAHCDAVVTDMVPVPPAFEKD